MLTPLPHPTVAAVLARAGRRNPMLGLGVDPQLPGGGSAARWLGPDAPALAAELIARVGARVGTGERRVAASLVVLGYAARLVGPAVALLVRDGVLLDLRPEQVTFVYAAGTGFQLALTPPAGGWSGPQPELVARWHADVVDGHLRPVIDAVRQVAPVATGLLWGNVAAGVTGALATLARDGAHPAADCHRVGAALLDHGRLAGTGRLTLGDGRVDFTRRSCCLYYRLPAGGTCPDCPLRGRPARLRPGARGAGR
jgi:ferric iron reductase protein FhuF